MREAAIHTCDPSAVCIAILVDEVRKLGASGAHKLCDELLAVQHSAMRGGRPMFAVAACLDVDSMFATVTRSSGHRLHPVPLYPCSRAEMSDFVSKCCAPRPTDKIRAMRNEVPLTKLESFAHSTGGNFHYLAEIYEPYPSFLDWEKLIDDKLRDRYYGCASEIVGRQLLSTERKFWMKETDVIGGGPSASAQAATALYDVICATGAVHYKEVDLTKNPPMVWPCIAPIVVNFRLITMLQNCQLFKESWSETLPRLEAIAAAKMSAQNGNQPVPLERLYLGRN